MFNILHLFLEYFGELALELCVFVLTFIVSIYKILSKIVQNYGPFPPKVTGVNESGL